MIQTIKDKIVEILESLAGTGASKKLAVVYGFANVDQDKLPSASVSLFLNPPEDRLDTASNLQSTTFLIRVLTVQQQTQAVEDIKIELIELITAEFRKKTNIDTLQGVAKNVKIAGIQPIAVTTGEQLVGFDMFISADTIEPLT